MVDHQDKQHGSGCSDASSDLSLVFTEDLREAFAVLGLNPDEIKSRQELLSCIRENDICKRLAIKHLPRKGPNHASIASNLVTKAYQTLMSELVQPKIEKAVAVSAPVTTAQTRLSFSDLPANIPHSCAQNSGRALDSTPDDFFVSMFGPLFLQLFLGPSTKQPSSQAVHAAPEKSRGPPSDSEAGRFASFDSIPPPFSVFPQSEWSEEDYQVGSGSDSSDYCYDEDNDWGDIYSELYTDFYHTSTDQPHPHHAWHHNWMLSSIPASADKHDAAAHPGSSRFFSGASAGGRASGSLLSASEKVIGAFHSPSGASSLGSSMLLGKHGNHIFRPPPAPTPNEEPARPEPPSLATVSDSCLELRWHPPESWGHPILKYILEMDSGPVAGINYKQVYAGVDPQHTVVNLQSGTEYHFLLKAENKNGSGGWSRSVSYKTSGVKGPTKRKAPVKPQPKPPQPASPSPSKKPAKQAAVKQTPAAKATPVETPAPAPAPVAQSVPAVGLPSSSPPSKPAPKEPAAKMNPVAKTNPAVKQPQPNTAASPQKKGPQPKVMAPVVQPPIPGLLSPTPEAAKSTMQAPMKDRAGAKNTPATSTNPKPTPPGVAKEPAAPPSRAAKARPDPKQTSGSDPSPDAKSDQKPSDPPCTSAASSLSPQNQLIGMGFTHLAVQHLFEKTPDLTVSAALELLLKGSQDDQWKDAGDRKAAATPVAAVLPDHTKQPSPALPTGPAVTAAATDVPVAANASEATDNVVHVWGLPWRVTREEIREFFSGLSLHADDSTNICIEVDENGKRTGDGFVRFADADTTRRSLGRHCKYMGHRYICVELGSQERMQHALRMSDPTKFPPELSPGPSPASSIPSPVVDPTRAPPRDTQKPKSNGHTVGAATTIAITPPGQQFAPQFLGPTNGGAGPPVTSNAPAPAVPFSWDAAHTYAEASQRASGTHPGSARQSAPPAQHPSAPSAINPAPSAVTHASSPFPFPSGPPDPNQAASRFSFVPFRTSNTLDPLFGSVFDPQFPSPSPALYSPFPPGPELDASFVPARSATDSLSWLTSNSFGPLDSRQSGLPPIGGLSDGVSGDPSSFPASNEFLHFGSFQPSPLGSLRELSASAVPTDSVGRSPRQSLALPGSPAALQPIGHPSSSSSASNSPSFDSLGPGGFFDFASPSLLQVTPDPELSPHRAASPAAPSSPSSLLPTPGFSSLTPAFLSSWSPLPSSEKPPFTGW